jgi:hypothetical protein
MPLISRISSQLGLAAVASIATSTIAVLPTQAATFASSGAFVNLDTFSQAAESTSTETDTEANAIFGQVLTVAQSNASFTPSPAKATNQTLSTVQGNGNFYLGQADSFAGVSGLFKVKKSETFSFKFLAQLGLNVAVDRPESEKAIAFGAIVLSLFNNQTNQLLDSFILGGQLNSTDFNTGSASSNHWSFKTTQSVDNEPNSTDFSSSIAGRYSRFFDSDVDVRLDAAQRNVAEATAVPEPGLGAGLVGLAAVFWMRKRSQGKRAAIKS